MAWESAGLMGTGPEVERWVSPSESWKAPHGHSNLFLGGGNGGQTQEVRDLRHLANSTTRVTQARTSASQVNQA